MPSPSTTQRALPTAPHFAAPQGDAIQARLQSGQNLNAPFSQAVWDYFVYHEIEGNVDVQDRNKRKEMANWINDNHEELVKSVIEQRNDGRRYGWR